MINIRPVPDLRNKYPEIEKLVLKEDVKSPEGYEKYISIRIIYL